LLIASPKPGPTSLSINNQKSTIKNSGRLSRPRSSYEPCGDSRLGCPSKAKGERPGHKP
jgi:hypothetical protein